MKFTSSRFIILLILLCQTMNGFGKTKIEFDFDKSADVSKSQYFRMAVISELDTLIVRPFNAKEDNSSIEIQITSENLEFEFQFSENGNDWIRNSYVVDVDTGIFLIKVKTNFSINDSNQEYLKIFSIERYYHAHDVELIPVFDLKIGETPLFKVTNHGKQTYYANNSLDIFYGTLAFALGGDHFLNSGAYCMSTEYGKPLISDDTLYSWVADTYHGAAKILTHGKHHYWVDFLEEKFSYSHADGERTTYRTRKIYRSEMEFDIPFDCEKLDSVLIKNFTDNNGLKQGYWEMNYEKVIWSSESCWISPNNGKSSKEIELYPLERGYYLNNERIGNWCYFSGDKWKILMKKEIYEEDRTVRLLNSYVDYQLVINSDSSEISGSIVHNEEPLNIKCKNWKCEFLIGNNLVKRLELSNFEGLEYELLRVRLNAYDEEIRNAKSR